MRSGSAQLPRRHFNSKFHLVTQSDAFIGVLISCYPVEPPPPIELHVANRKWLWKRFLNAPRYSQSGEAAREAKADDSIDSVQHLESLESQPTR